ncbi:MAG TPA: ATP-binding protein [Roseiflexaceae bacterium]|nr:ATP-binding protein [Roseiflexaceae bacterium]
MSNVFALRVAADVEHLAAIRAFVERQALALGTDSSAIYDLALAVNEMATNIVVHGYRGRPGTIEIELRPLSDAIEVRLRDKAPLFDPTGVAAPDLSLPLHQRPLGGMGLHLTRNAIDALSYRVTPEGENELTLLKCGILAGSRKE